MTVRQMNRLLKFWVAEAGLDPKKYGKESLRRTKALHILLGARLPPEPLSYSMTSSARASSDGDQQRRDGTSVRRSHFGGTVRVR
jgi:hypothetical protein